MTTKGSGPGLVNEFGVVRQDNSSIQGYHEPGRGAECRSDRPRAVEKASTLDVPLVAEAHADAREWILLVDDEPSIRELCKRFLARLGYHVLSTETPGEALQTMRDHAEDIRMLLTDIFMPEMDGYQLALRICAIKPDIRVMFMSGYAADMMFIRGLLGRDVGFLSKPFTQPELAIRVHEVLRGAPEQRTNPNFTDGSPPPVAVESKDVPPPSFREHMGAASAGRHGWRSISR